MEYRVLIPDTPFGDRCEPERSAVDPGFEFHAYREWPSERVPLRILRSCDALICYGTYHLPAWTAGMLERCRIVVRTCSGLNYTDLGVFGERGIPVCTPSPLGRWETGRGSQPPGQALLDEELRREAARTVALFLRDGFLRNCVNSRRLRLRELRLDCAPGHPLMSAAPA